MRRARVGAVIAAGLALATGGCVTDRFPDAAPAGVSPAAASLGEQTSLGADVEAFFRPEGPETVTVVMVPGGGGERPDRLTVLRVMWRPKASATPLDQTATNTAVRHLVFADPAPRPGARRGGEGAAESLGAFSGGGFVKLGGDPTAAVLEVVLREADLRLTDCSPGYDHPLRRTRLSGRVEARRDDATVTRLLRETRTRAADALGYPAW